MKLTNTVFVVTGAGGGIGGELVLGLLRRGARVAAVDLRDESFVNIREKAAEYGDALSTYAVDITDRQAVAALPDAVVRTHGQVDGLINCAGIIQSFVRINDLDFEAIERVMNVNFYGTVNMTKSFLPHLLERQEAYVANVSSMGGFLPVPGQSAYGASKAAVKLLTEGLYAELLNTPVHVSIVFPGATKTDITKNSKVDIPTPAGVDTEKMSARTLPADQAADIILDGLERNQPQIFTGSDSKLMNRLYRINPVFATKFIAKQMKELLK